VSPTVPLGIKGIAESTPSGGYMDNVRAMMTGLDLSLAKRLFLVVLSFHVVLKEQMIGPAKLGSN